MGVIHYAYYFDRNLTGLEVAKCLDSQKQLPASVYEAQIAQAGKIGEGLGMQFLDDLCFDREDWTSETTGDHDRVEKLVKVYLAKNISGVHKLSQSSFALIELLLPTFNWNMDRIRLLLMGRQFNHLIKTIGFIGLDSHGGHLVKSPSWLPFDDVQQLTADFKSEREQFVHPTLSSMKMVEAARSRMFLGDQSGADLMQKAFTEMVGRLERCVQTGHDLLLINEVASYQKVALEPV